MTQCSVSWAPQLFPSLPDIPATGTTRITGPVVRRKPHKRQHRTHETGSIAIYTRHKEKNRIV